MKINKIKLLVAGLVFGASIAFTGTSANAANIDLGTETTHIGETEYYNTSSIKINGKSYKKAKKKIKTVVSSVNNQDEYYRTKSYFNDSDAYATYAAYEADNGEQAKKYLPKTSQYGLTFLKTGSYKIKYVDYHFDKYGTTREYLNGTYKTYITKYNYATDEYEKLSSYVMIPSRGGRYMYYDDYDDYYSYYDDDYDESGNNSNTYKAGDGKIYNKAEEPYFICSDGKVYGVGKEGLVPASLAKGADGYWHVKYTPKKAVKDTYTKTFKVLNTDSIVKTIKLGKSTKTYSSKLKNGGFSSVIVRGGFLTGSKGKLAVTMADKNYNNGGMLVKTADADGNNIYTVAKNKSSVKYSDYEAKSSEGSDDSWYKSSTSSMYKETTVIVAYENKAEGYGTKIVSTGVNSYKITNYSKSKHNGKYYTLKTVYDVKYEKRDGYDKPRYFYTVTRDKYDKATKKVVSEKDKNEIYKDGKWIEEVAERSTLTLEGGRTYDEEDGYWYSSEGLIYYYQNYSFYKK